jgi:hypothetical protein
MKEVASIADRLNVLLPIEVKLGQAQEQMSMFHIFSDDAIDDMTDSFPLVKGYQLKGHPNLCVGNYGVGVFAQYMPRKKVFVVKYYKPERESRALKVAIEGCEYL